MFFYKMGPTGFDSMMKDCVSMSGFARLSVISVATFLVGENNYALAA
jgi:hypothetical protein|tara:strand:- start:549 stop:689 length:141 start_codon:yes stop_codon:yes gene_type:complete